MVVKSGYLHIGRFRGAPIRLHWTLPLGILAFTRFRFPWQWDGKETVLQSRCTDESGYVQPPLEALVAARGMNSQYHCNAIKPWKVAADGSVTNA